MAIARSGTLTCKRGWFHFVSRAPDGKLKWQALHTQNKEEARKRVAKLTGSALVASDRTAWLKSLVDTGRWAQMELDAMAGKAEAEAVEWPDLMARWQSVNAGLTRHAPTLEIYELYLKALERWAAEAGVESPGTLTPRQAAEYMGREGAAESGRDADLFRRVWRDLGLNAECWPKLAKAARTADRYRRLSVGEVRAIVKTLRMGKTTGREKGRWTKGAVKALPDVADLVALAYHTGLRRGDAADLRVKDVDEDGRFLRVIPSKTAASKGHTLLIPLQDEAREIVDRLLAETDGEPNDPLFPRLAGAWLNKCLARAFERAGVADSDHGRASFHSLRATFISMMDEAGVPPHVTDAITGHAKAGMHGRYTQPGREAMTAAVERAITPLGVC